ncbi:glycosyl hydrolase [Aquabacterium sp. A7-Y]|uniref:glycosyl hydrolase n=1 Tax=Aquabacterium sp. A7-Y TaxID=1349605 RepID=UPI00223E73AB|nr:glycosyl hydrolase [Aquabacterium sp. A7-Y]MCW7537300.1 glycosyl hydrolase [Aquabacterium sp. A7-Y]
MRSLYLEDGRPRPGRPAPPRPSVPARWRSDTPARLRALMGASALGLAALLAPAGAAHAVIDLPADSSTAAASESQGGTGRMQAAGASAPPLTPKVNAWGKQAPKYQIEVPRSGRPAAKEGGGAQAVQADRPQAAAAGPVRFRLLDKGDGDAHLIYPYAFKAGTTYRARVRIRSDRDAQVQAMLRRDEPPWDPFDIETVRVTPKWQTVELEGTAMSNGPASLRVASRTLGADLWVDQVEIDEVRANSLEPRLKQPIPDSFFGMHLMRLGIHTNWPSFNPGVIRLWDTRTNWKDLQPEEGRWDFSGPSWKRMDLYVNHTLKHNPQAKIIYTMGQVPRWTSTQPDWKNGYGLGHGAAPRDMELWRDYVRTVGKRYAGRIRYWEIWNEPDYAAFYKGSVEDMVKMARIANEELKAIDPQNVLLSPGLTTHQGVAWLDRFLALGGGRYVDVIAFHWYYDRHPESIASSIQNVRRVMRKHRVEDKPLWNTEGSLTCNPKMDDCKQAFHVSEAEQRGVNLRAMLTMWGGGVQSFAYYHWEGRFPDEKMLQDDFRTPTLSGRAYARAVDWLRGARLVDAWRSGRDVYIYKLQRGDQPVVIAWSLTPDTEVRLPVEWGVRRVARLDGSVDALGESRTLSLGLEPVMLQ